MDSLLVIVGDDLIMEQIRNFQPDLHQKGMKFFEHIKMMDVFLAALSRVIMILRDLTFWLRILRGIYILFYEVFLKPVQALLDWKKIDVTDIAHTYQIGSAFLFFVSGECEKLVGYDLYVHEGTPEEQKYAESWVTDNSKDSGDVVIKILLNGGRVKINTATPMWDLREG